jgi:hypothetical protein
MASPNSAVVALSSLVKLDGRRLGHCLDDDAVVVFSIVCDFGFASFCSSVRMTVFAAVVPNLQKFVAFFVFADPPSDRAFAHSPSF